MSWEAVAWANRQKLKKSFEQIVLLVLANCADADGESFSKWPSKEHWWKYLSERTRLPRSSLFRHLNTIVGLGLGERAMLVLSDGTRRPTIKLNMAASFDIDCDEDRARYDALFSKSESLPETHDSEDAECTENGNDFSHENNAPEVESPIETPEEARAIPSAGNDPFPVAGMHKDSINLSKDSPLPPSGGPSAVDPLWDEFVRSWGEAIQRMTLTRTIWDRTATEKRPTIIAAAKGFWAYQRAQSKPKTAQSAQSFLRDEIGWPQWLRYTPSGDGIQTSSPGGYPLESAEGKAIIVAHDIVGSDAVRQFMLRQGTIYHRVAMTPRLTALSQAPPRAEWVGISAQQAAAWEGLLREIITVQVRKRLKEGDSAPWPWPPAKDGRIYTDTGPPHGELSDEEAADFTA